MSIDRERFELAVAEERGYSHGLGFLGVLLAFVAWLRRRR